MDDWPGARTVEEFHRQISDAYTRSPLEISIFVGFFVILLGILFGYRRHVIRQEKQAEAERTERLYQQALRRTQLSPSQIELLNTLAEAMQRPTERYLLFEDESLFNSCAVRAMEQKQVAPDAVAGLRIILGFDSDGAKAPHSTTQLKPGATVLLRGRAKDKPVAAEISSSSRSMGLELRCRPERMSRLPLSGRAIQLIYHNAAGIFVFESLVLSREDGTVVLRHAEQPQRLQRRRYFRRSVQRPVRIERVSPEGADLNGVVFDLGGGGAALELVEIDAETTGHKDKPPDIGDLLYLYLEPEPGEVWKLQARVVRVSPKGIHVVFTALQEQDRDKIYRYLFRSE
ncbi:MAG: PilZ domain-containing protein [Spirochaetaceae bacterium]|nr:MAG: PilZ domain-containing protein [Spirochaetaceae bacterium]